MEYQALQTIYPEDDEEDLRRPTGIRIIVFHDQKFMKTDVVFETPNAKMPKKNKRKKIMKEEHRMMYH
ncbi:hypothetical protein IC582_026574 [Cucumis melo]